MFFTFCNYLEGVFNYADEKYDNDGNVTEILSRRSAANDIEDQD